MYGSWYAPVRKRPLKMKLKSLCDFICIALSILENDNINSAH